MNIIVCIKSVVTSAPGEQLVRTADRCALNPFDRPVLEVALRLKQARGGRVTALSMGPPTAEASLREALAIGVDRAVRLGDPLLAGSDTLATATALSAALRHLAPFDLVLFGTRTSDSDTGQVGPQTAVLLGIPLLTGVLGIDAKAVPLVVERRVDGFAEVYELTPPAACTIHPAAAAPREPALASIGRAFDDGAVETLTAAQVGLDPRQVGEAGSPTRVLSMRPVKKDRSCRWIEGPPAQQADLLVRYLLDAGLVG